MLFLSFNQGNSVWYKTRTISVSIWAIERRSIRTETTIPSRFQTVKHVQCHSRGLTIMRLFNHALNAFCNSLEIIRFVGSSEIP